MTSTNVRKQKRSHDIAHEHMTASSYDNKQLTSRISTINTWLEFDIVPMSTKTLLVFLDFFIYLRWKLPYGSSVTYCFEYNLQTETCYVVRTAQF